MRGNYQILHFIVIKKFHKFAEKAAIMPEEVSFSERSACYMGKNFPLHKPVISRTVCLSQERCCYMSYFIILRLNFGWH